MQPCWGYWGRSSYTVVKWWVGEWQRCIYNYVRLICYLITFLYYACTHRRTTLCGSWNCILHTTGTWWKGIEWLAKYVGKLYKCLIKSVFERIIFGFFLHRPCQRSKVYLLFRHTCFENLVEIIVSTQFATIFKTFFRAVFPVCKYMC